MKVVSGFGSLDKGPRAPKALTIGVFDGVHRGHQKIFSRLFCIARRRKMPSAVVTFETHPTRALPGKERVLPLTSLEHKLMLLDREGVDACYVIDFTPAFAGLEPEDFVKDVLIGKIGMGALVVGEDFVFGRGGRGDVPLLRELSRREKFFFDKVPHLKMGGRVVSSTRIRRLIAQGDLKQAGALLGRPVSLLGEVVRGEGRGRTLGFPTANVDTPHEVLLPDGIYASRARFCGHWRKGITYIGVKPTFSKGPSARSIEVYLFDFKKNIYGRSLEVEFLGKIRPDKKFPDVTSLRTQMRDDVRVAKKFLKRFS